MIKKVYTILKACNVPLEYISRPIISTMSPIVISYHFFNQEGEMFEEGEEVESSGTLQVDLFAKDEVDFTTIKAQVKQSLISNGFFSPRFYDDQEDVEGAGLVNHVVITANYLESEVLNNG